jgi:hypothetical protein
MWLSIAFAAMGVAIVALVITLRGVAPGSSPAARPQAAVAVAPPAVPARAEVRPALQPPAATAAPARGASPPPSRRPVGSTADPSHVHINTAGIDPGLRGDLSNALEAAGLSVVDTTASAGVQIVSARIQISLRPSPFQQTSATTADFVVALQLRKSGAPTLQTLQLEGHAMEFGEPAVRAAAYRRAAEQIADAVRTATRTNH